MVVLTCPCVPCRQSMSLDRMALRRQLFGPSEFFVCGPMGGEGQSDRFTSFEVAAFLDWLQVRVSSFVLLGARSGAGQVGRRWLTGCFLLSKVTNCSSVVGLCVCCNSSQAMLNCTRNKKASSRRTLVMPVSFSFESGFSIRNKVLVAMSS